MPTIVQRAFPSFLIVLLAMLIYANSFPGSFFVGDLKLLGQNSHLTELNTVGIMTSDFWGPDASTGEYRPLSALSLALDHRLFGTDPLGYHLQNVLLGAAVSLLLFALLCRLNIPLPISWLAAAIFAVHPAHALTVNEVLGRAPLLGMLFFLLALLWSRKEGRAGLLGPPVLFAAALLSHESTLALLVALPLVDGFFSEKAGLLCKKRLPLYLSLLLVCAGWLLLRSLIQVGPAPADGLAFFERLAGATSAQLEVLGQLLFPLGLAGGTAIPTAPGSLNLMGGVLYPLFGVATLAAIWGWKSRSLLSLAVLLSGSTFVVSVGTSFIGLSTGSHSYLLSAWICFLAASLLCSFLRYRIAWCASLVLVLLLGGLTLERNLDFRSPETLLRSELERDPQNVQVWALLGEYLSFLGQDEQAVEAYFEAIRLEPESGDANLNYAIYLARRDRTDEGAHYALRAVEAAPDLFQPEAYLIMGMGYFKLEEPEESLKWLDKLGDHFDDSAVYWETRGMAQEFTGQFEEALTSYQRELTIGAVNPSAARIRTGRLLLALGQHEQAENMLREELQFKQSADAYNFLGVALVLQERIQEAFETFERAVMLDPDNPGYMENYERAGIALESSGELLPK